MPTCDKGDDGTPSPASCQVNARKSSPPQALVRKKCARLWEASEGWGCEPPPREQQQLKRCLLWSQPLY